MMGLLGFRVQGMDGRKAAGSVAEAPSVFGVGTHTFTAAKSGLYEIAAWGPGGNGNNNVGQRGTQGGFSLKRIRLRKGQTIAITVSRPASSTTVNWGSGQITITSGTNAAGTAGVNGAATGGDINLNGDQTSGNTGLGGISYQKYKAGSDTSSTSGTAAQGTTPGGGANYGSTDNYGGDGLVIISRIA